MGITKITVKGLFNQFNYSIPLNSEDGITIIHAPNGYGKTTILKMVDDILNMRLLSVYNAPFKEYKICFKNKDYLRIWKNGVGENNSKKETYVDMHIEFYEKKTRVKDEFIFPPRKNTESLYGPYIRRINEPTPEYHLIKEASFSEVIKRRHIINRIRAAHESYSNIENTHDETECNESDESEYIPPWLIALYQKYPTRLIQAQRLETTEFGDIDRISAEKKLTAVEYLKELHKTIGSKLEDYALFSQELERYFPDRLFKFLDSNLEIEDQDSIVDRWNTMEGKRQRLETAGLWDKGTMITLPRNMDETKRTVLSLYLDDYELKLAHFDELEEKIGKLKQIINKKFEHKELKITKGTISFLTSNGVEISADKLSSGEQHQVVLNYELLFRSKKGAIILLDEPEISLHVGWQRSFLADLEEIVKISGIQVIIATHSPQIVHLRQDLLVPLKPK